MQSLWTHSTGVPARVYEQRSRDTAMPLTSGSTPDGLAVRVGLGVSIGVGDGPLVMVGLGLGVAVGVPVCALWQQWTLTS